MHTSRMCTTRLLTISQHALCRRGVCIPACTGQGAVCVGGVWQTPPMNRMTDRSKNITWPQLCYGAVKSLVEPEIFQIFQHKVFADTAFYTLFWDRTYAYFMYSQLHTVDPCVCETRCSRMSCTIAYQCNSLTWSHMSVQW